MTRRTGAASSSHWQRCGIACRLELPAISAATAPHWEWPHTTIAIHRLDAVLTDEPATASFKIKVFSHLLGESNVAICATPKLARVLRKGFPKSLHGAPALLPTSNTTLRRALDEWFHAIGIQPRVVAEFEDGALMKIAAANGQGFVPVPTVGFLKGTGY